MEKIENIQFIRRSDKIEVPMNIGLNENRLYNPSWTKEVKEKANVISNSYGDSIDTCWTYKGIDYKILSPINGEVYAYPTPDLGKLVVILNDWDNNDSHAYLYSADGKVITEIQMLPIERLYWKLPNQNTGELPYFLATHWRNLHGKVCMSIDICQLEFYETWTLNTETGVIEEFLFSSRK